MPYYVSRAGQQYGPYSLSQLEQMAREGRFSPTDLVWREELNAWRPASEVIGHISPETPPPVAETARPQSPPPPQAPAPETPAQPPSFGAYVPPGATGGAVAVAPPGDFNIGLAFSAGWKAFSDNVGLLIGAILLFGILHLIGSLIPFVSILYGLIIAPPFTAGLAILSLKLIDKRPASVGDIFAGFEDFGRYLGAYWLMFLICLAVYVVTAIPLLIAALITAAIENSSDFTYGSTDNTIVAIWVVAAIVALAILVAGLIRFVSPYIFAFFVIADRRDNGSSMGALRESARLVGERRFVMSMVVLLCGIVGVAGMLVLCLGYLVTGPWMLCAMGAIYRQIAGPPKTIPALGTRTITPPPSYPQPQAASPTPAAVGSLAELTLWAADEQQARSLCTDNFFLFGVLMRDGGIQAKAFLEAMNQGKKITSRITASARGGYDVLLQIV